jgi:hypothetical protein
MRGIIGVGVGTKRACGSDAVVLSMGLVWTEVCLLAQRGTNLGKGFSSYFFKITTHVLIVRYMCCKYAYCAIHIFLLCS